MLKNIKILSPDIALEQGSPLFKIPLDEKEKAAQRLREADRKWGYDCERQYDYLNNYDNDDYVFVADLLQDVRNIHRLIYFNPINNVWIRGCSEIPYIHFEFIQQDVWKKGANGMLLRDENGNLIPDDTKLNMGVKPPAVNGTHKLVFNYYWLGQYLKFLKNIFDDNEELTVQLPDLVAEGKRMEPSYGTKEDILKLADDIERSGLIRQAETLRLYAVSSIKKTKIQIPALTFITEAGIQKHIGWSFFDEARNVITLDMKKGIYNTSGFASLFRERNTLISDIFISTLEMILGHEVAHIARGHWNLRVKEPEFSAKRNVMMNCEVNADWTSMKWLLNELLYVTIDGNPYCPVLAYTRNRLLYLWSIRVFAAYLALSWGYREEDRVWTIKTVDQFRADKEATHPIYQFRLACVLNHAQEHIIHMGNTCEKESHKLFSADGIRLDKEFFQEVWSNSLNLIHSFEVGLRSSWGKDIRSTLQKLNDGLYVERMTREGNIHKVPFMIASQEQAKEELAAIEQEWPEVKKHLRQCGMYYPLDVS